MTVPDFGYQRRKKRTKKEVRHSDYIRFGAPVVVEEFNGRIREDYASVVGEVKNYADQYLNLEVNGKWLVRALM